MFETVGDPTPKELKNEAILELREEVKEPRKTFKVQISSQNIDEEAIFGRSSNDQKKVQLELEPPEQIDQPSDVVNLPEQVSNLEMVEPEKSHKT